MPTTGDGRVLVPPGRRELDETWTASGVSVRIEGRSRIPEGVHTAFHYALGAASALLILAGLYTLAPDPGAPKALACTVETRWSPECGEVGPKALKGAVSPNELTRRLAANWDFDLKTGLSRDGTAAHHIERQALEIRGSDAVDAAALTRLASVITTPESYGAWTVDRADLDVVHDAEGLSALYASEADTAWAVHQDALSANHTARVLAHQGRQATVSAWLPALGLGWLGFGLLVLGGWLLHRREVRSMQVALTPQSLVVDGATLPIASLGAIRIDGDRIALDLRDGSTWTSRPIAPRSATRLEQILDNGLRTEPHAQDEALARADVHRELARVLSRTSS